MTQDLSHIPAGLRTQQLVQIEAAARTRELFEEHKKSIYIRTDHLFVWLMPLQWLVGLAFALWISPTAWDGAYSTIHPHVWAALFLGGSITFWPVYCAIKHPGMTATRYLIAVGQMLMSALLIHLSGGRIETHFHVFGSLAVLACYRDWRVLVAASAVVAIDHFVRGVYFPLSVFGVLTASPYRWIEHAAWVAFEDVFLIISIRQSVKEMLGIAERQATLETMNVGVERTVAERTAELRKEIAEREKVEQHLRQIQHDNDLIFGSITEGIHRIDSDGRITFENPAAARMLGWDVLDLIGRPAHKTIHHTRADGSPYPQCECPIYAGLTGNVAYRVDDEVFWRKDGTSFPVEYTTTPVRDEGGSVIGAVVVFSDSTERKRAEGARKQLADQLAQERERFAEILNNIPVLVFENSLEGQTDAHFVNGYVEKMYGYTREEWTSTPDFWFSRVHPEDKERVAANVAERFATDFSGSDTFRSISKDGRIVWSETHVVALRDETGQVIGARGVTIDITERKKVEAEMERMHTQLMDASRHAGMAEVATNVLHNVGNVLNSVNISHSVVSTKMRDSAIDNVTRLANLLEEHANDLAAFLTTDRAGQNVAKFLGKLANRLTAEQESILAELGVLGQNIEHIKEIIAVQQSYAQAGGVHEILPLTDLVESALQINGTALIRHRIQIVREYGDASPASLEKHKVMQILVNLVSNAKHALTTAKGCNDRRLVLRTARNNGRISVSVSDNGIGISAENMTRIFAHGFTTKKDGHGFGLHGAAIAAKEMGGSLSVESVGLGHGTTFTLELPLSRNEAKEK